jgi:hypothetical protein
MIIDRPSCTGQHHEKEIIYLKNNKYCIQNKILKETNFDLYENCSEKRRDLKKKKYLGRRRGIQIWF